jgi:prevent-host-death family protein
MKTISVSEFKTRCLAVVAEVHSTREPVLITKRGKPFLRLVPAGKPGKFIGRLKGVFKIVGDIESPVYPPEAWEYD